MAAPLTPDEIRDRLASLPSWRHEGKTITKTIGFADFRAAIAFVNKVAEVAEAADHHPDIFIHYREVTLILWTHTADGLTGRDFRIAAEIDRLD